MSGTAAARRLRLLRSMYRSRGSQRPRVDLAYLVYLLVFATITAFFPIARAIVLALLSPSAADVLRAAAETGDGARAVALIAGLLTVAAAGLGAIRGPVAPSPFFVALLAGGPLPRQISLGGPFRASLAVLLVVLAASAALLGAGIGGAVAASMTVDIIRSAGAALALGCVIAAVWLAGQVLGPRAWWIAAPLALAVALTAAAALPVADAVLWATPWGLAGLATFGSAAALSLLALLATAALLGVRPLLGVLREEALLAQARSWEVAAVSAGLGDFQAALGSLRAQPGRFRRLRAVRRLPLLALFLVRDLVGAARTPVRLALSLLVLATGAAGVAAVAGAVGITGSPDTAAPALLGAAWGMLCHVGAGGLADGFRHAADTAGSPALYRWGTGRLYLLHAGFPTIAVALVVLVGGAALRPDAGLLLLVALVALVGVVSRAFDSLKGPLPVVLTTPIPSPAGDPSILFQLLWRADALVAAGGVGALAIHLGASNALTGAGAACAGIIALALLARRRIVRAV